MRKIIPDYTKSDGRWSTGAQAGFTLGGSRWYDMTKRCKVGGRTQRIQPTYVGVTCEFKSAHDFIEWGRQQIGYFNVGWHLDKDILKKGNKIYCKELCVFVPNAINCLLISCNSSRGEWPIGVTYRESANKFVAQIQRNGRQDYLGRFDTPEPAFAAYKYAKEAEIKRVADIYKDVIDPRVYSVLHQHEVQVND